MRASAGDLPREGLAEAWTAVAPSCPGVAGLPEAHEARTSARDHASVCARPSSRLTVGS